MLGCIANSLLVFLFWGTSSTHTVAANCRGEKKTTKFGLLTARLLPKTLVTIKELAVLLIQALNSGIVPVVLNSKTKSGLCLWLKSVLTKTLHRSHLQSWHSSEYIVKMPLYVFTLITDRATVFNTHFQKHIKMLWGNIWAGWALKRSLHVTHKLWSHSILLCIATSFFPLCMKHFCIYNKDVLKRYQIALLAFNVIHYLQSKANRLLSWVSGLLFGLEMQ